MFNEFQELLLQVSLHASSQDKVTWKYHNSGFFSVKSFIKTVSGMQYFNVESQHIFSSIWCGLTPLRVELLVWLALLGKLNTKSWLAHLNIIHGDNIRCILCNFEEETINHLFMHCVFSWKIWCFASKEVV